MMQKTIIDTNINLANHLLAAGEVVAIPTETVYGLAANALNDDAVLKVFAAKERPFFDPLIIHVHSVEAVSQWVEHIPNAAKVLFEHFSPGPITILLKKKKNISDLVTAGLEQVAVRIPNHQLTLSLLEQLNLPLAAPSANPFGYISPTSAQHVFDQLQGKIPMILDGGVCKVGVESTIIGFEGEKAIVYRLGGLAIEAIEAVIGSVIVQTNQSSNPTAPGMLKSHYAPRKPLFLGDVEKNIQLQKGKKIGLLLFSKSRLDFPHQQQIVLAPDSSLETAAKSLFAAMRTLDISDVECIIAEKMPNEGLGKAINDRLQRAAA